MCNQQVSIVSDLIKMRAVITLTGDIGDAEMIELNRQIKRELDKIPKGIKWTSIFDIRNATLQEEDTHDSNLWDFLIKNGADAMIRVVDPKRKTLGKNLSKVHLPSVHTLEEAHKALDEVWNANNPITYDRISDSILFVSHNRKMELHEFGQALAEFKKRCRAMPRPFSLIVGIDQLGEGQLGWMLAEKSAQTSITHGANKVVAVVSPDSTYDEAKLFIEKNGYFWDVATTIKDAKEMLA